MFNNNFEFEIHDTRKDEEGNFLALDLTIEKNRLTLVNLYGPNSDNPIFYENLFKMMDHFHNVEYIICGDFNLILNPEKDTDNYIHINNPRAREKLLSNIDDYNLKDCFRILHPDTTRYTWRRKKPRKQARLDFHLTSENILSLIEKCNIQAGYRTDHSLITLEIKINNFIKGKGVWKFNISLLHDTEYVRKVKETIERVKEQCTIDTEDNNIEIENKYKIDDQLMLEIILVERQ